MAKTIKRVYIEKPTVGSQVSTYASGEMSVKAVGMIQKDILGREFFEVVLEVWSSPGEVCQEEGTLKTFVPPE